MKIKEYVSAMSRLWVEGEIVTLQRRPGARVQFFTLSDTEAKVSITVKIMTHLLPADLDAGRRVVVCAKPDFYDVNGSLSLWADEVRPVGVGDILVRLEQLKARLAAEGLFAPGRKRRLPFLPRVIGLICGRNTKAKEDVVVNSRLRWPSAHFDVREVQVQGSGAVDAMVEALRLLDAAPDVDVIVLARGGGSVEDLLPFSDERLVRAVASASTPVVSAVGHEGDNPILDLAADLRASTPTDAAKRIVPDVTEEIATITQAVRRGRGAIASAIDRAQYDLDAIRARPSLSNPHSMVDVRQMDIEALSRWLRAHASRIVSEESGDLQALLAKLRALSPRDTLERGYSILLDETGAVVDDAATTRANQHLQAFLAKGHLTLAVLDDSRLGGDHG